MKLFHAVICNECLIFCLLAMFMESLNDLMHASKGEKTKQTNKQKKKNPKSTKQVRRMPGNLSVLLWKTKMQTATFFLCLPTVLTTHDGAEDSCI